MFLKSQFVFKGTVCFKVFLLEQFWGGYLGCLEPINLVLKSCPVVWGQGSSLMWGGGAWGVGGEKPRGGSGAERS